MCVSLVIAAPEVNGICVPQHVLSQVPAILLSLLVALMITITLLVVIVHMLVLMRKERQVHNKEQCVLVSLLHGGCDHPACTYAN